MNLEKEIDQVEKEMDVFYKILDEKLIHASLDERNDVIVSIKKLQSYRDLLIARSIARELMEG